MAIYFFWGIRDDRQPGMSPEIPFAAASLLIRYVMTLEPVADNVQARQARQRLLERASIVALILSIKFKDYDDAAVQFVLERQYGPGADNAHIWDLEILFWSALGFNATPHTPAESVTRYIEELNRRFPGEEHRYAIIRFAERIYRRMRPALVDIQWNLFEPDQIAASAYFIEAQQGPDEFIRQNISDIVGFNVDQLTVCLNWLMIFSP